MFEGLLISDPLAIGLIALTCGWIILAGKVNWATGVFASAMFWAYAVRVSSLSLLWILVATLLASAAIRTLREMLGGKTISLREPRNVPILVWVSLWMLWMFLLFLLFPTEHADRLFRNTLVYNLLSFGSVLFILNDLRQIRGMVYAFIATTIVVGVLSLSLLPIPLEVLLQDPSFRLRGITQVNYLTFAIPFAISMVFAFVLFLSPKSRFEQLGAVYAFLTCSIFLVLTGARQSMLAVTVAIVVILIWVLKDRRGSRSFLFILLALSSFIVYRILDTTALLGRWSLVGEDLSGRAELWNSGLDFFIKSPIWGNGLDYALSSSYAHNLFLDTLAAQGLVGAVYLIGLLAFSLYALRDAWTWRGLRELAIWRIGALAALIYVLVQSSFSGTVAGVPHLFWVTALIWKLWLLAQDEVISKRSPAPSAFESSPSLMLHRGQR